MKIKIKFKLEDLWLGVYWDRELYPEVLSVKHNVYICLLPCLPIHISWFKQYRNGSN